jgi:hypothetical protein
VRAARRLLVLGIGLVSVSAWAEPAAAPAQVGFDHPVAAGSWGGIVRAGPGQDEPRLASLREGEPVMLLANTGIMRDGYPWFLIRFRGNQLGFQWGGILCRTETPIEGVFESCRR